MASNRPVTKIMKNRIVPEVLDRAEWLESLGIDPSGYDGFFLSSRLNWFADDCVVAGIPECYEKKLRALFIRWAAPMMVYEKKKTL